MKLVRRLRDVEKFGMGSKKFTWDQRVERILQGVGRNKRRKGLEISTILHIFHAEYSKYQLYKYHS